MMTFKTAWVRHVNGMHVKESTFIKVSHYSLLKLGTYFDALTSVDLKEYLEFTFIETKEIR